MRFQMIKGDGDQTILGTQFIAKQVKAMWFPGVLTGSPAKLFRIKDSALMGQYIAISSRTNTSIEQQCAANRGYASVIVHSIKCPGTMFVENASCTDQVGMALIRAL